MATQAFFASPSSSSPNRTERAAQNDVDLSHAGHNRSKHLARLVASGMGRCDLKRGTVRGGRYAHVPRSTGKRRYGGGCEYDCATGAPSRRAAWSLSPDETWLLSSSDDDSATVSQARRVRIAERVMARQGRAGLPATTRCSSTHSVSDCRAPTRGARRGASHDACCRCCPRRSTDSPRLLRPRPRRALRRRPTMRCRAPGRG